MKYVLFLSLLALSVFAHSDLLISPTSVLISDRERVAKITLVNRGSSANTYRLSMVNLIQNQDGSYTNTEEGEFEYSAREFIRFSPRQVSLQPGERQTVKLLIRRNNSMQTGDYRSHLSFKVLPRRQEDNMMESQAQEKGIKLLPNISYTIPVVVRVGEPDARVQLAELSLVSGSDNALLDIRREGNYGVLGKIELFALNSGNGEELIGELNNANIFRESAGRQFSIKLDNPDKIKSGDQLLVKYSDISERKSLLSEVTNILYK